MSSFTIGGLSTGIDYNELISKLMEVKRQPITILENKVTTYNDRMSSYSELSSKLSSLKSAADKLKYDYSFYVNNTTVSDETVLDATASGTASVGNYSIGVTSLASEEKEAHSGTGLTASTTIVNNSGSDKVFQYTYAGTQRSLTVANGTTLDGLKNLINNDASNPSVTATTVNDGTNYRLVITGNSTGSAKSITVDAGTTLDGNNSTINFTAATFTQNKTAANAAFTVDGLSISRSTNSVSDVITGLTINLKKAAPMPTPATATISVAADNASIKEQINDFVSAYNDVMSFLKTNTAYDSATGESGILSGEGTARSIQNRIRDIASGDVAGLSGSLSMLAEIGISTDYKTGNLVIDSSKLDAKLGSNLDDVAELFQDSTNGIATGIFDYIGDLTSTVDGAITLRKDGLSDIIKDITNTIRNMEFRLDKAENDMVRQFTALEKIVGNYNSIGNYLSNFSTKA
ncbi:MAG: flagellar filament capping protein FliD [Nitrospirae bacterium]|nr:flagellar filament capping protein FliD [Nitrospirota bacterium]